MPPRKKKTGWTRKPKKKVAVAPPPPTALERAGKSFSKLPLELRRMIGSYLVDDPVSSICLGVTCKKFIEVHRMFHQSPIRLYSSTYTAEGSQRLLKYLLRDWMPRGLVFDWETQKLANPQKLKDQGARYTQLLQDHREDVEERMERDRVRIAERKRDRRRYGHVKYQSQWSDLSATSSNPSTAFYEPSEGNSSGTTEHSRGYWRDEEQRENARLGLEYDGPRRDSSGNPIIDMHATWNSRGDYEDADNYSEDEYYE